MKEDELAKLMNILKGKKSFKKSSKRKGDPNKPDVNWDIPKPGKVKVKLKMDLYPYQVEGVGMIKAFGGRCLLGDEMGLGKTAQAIAFCKMNKAERIVVVCPATLKENWKREFAKWVGWKKSVYIAEGFPNVDKSMRRRFYAYLRRFRVVIVNYDILPERGDLPGWNVMLRNFQHDHLIIDECHYMMNRKASRSKAVREIARQVPNIIAISGTPILNKPLELPNVMNLLKPGLIRAQEYKQRYCDPTRTNFGMDYNGASNLDELHKMLTANFMVRRKKMDVLKELPPKTRTVVPLAITNRSEYTRASTDFKKWLLKTEGKKLRHGEGLVKIEKLKQLATKGKIAACVQWIKDFLDTGEKLVVFTTHTLTLEIVQKAFKDKCVVLNGSTSQKARQKAVDSFQEDDSVRLFVGNLKAAGVGITLTAASNTCHLELGWVPGEHDQAEDRVHRIGQASSVMGWYLIARDTVEEPIAQLLDDKRKVVQKVLDGEEVADFSLLTRLLDQL